MIKQSSGRLMMRRLTPLLKGLTAGVIALTALSVLSALCYSIAGAPEGTDTVLSYISSGLAAAAGGMFCAAANGKNGLLWGSAAGAEMFVVFLIGAVISQNFDGGALIAKLLLCIACSAAGGVFGVNKLTP